MIRMLTLACLSICCALAVAADKASAKKQTKQAVLVVEHAFSNPTSIQNCFSHVHRCVVPVYVHAADPTGAHNTCTAWIDPHLVNVPPPTGGIAKIKIIWVLKKGDPSTDIKKYTFDPNRGVEATAATNQFKSDGLDGPDGNNSDPTDPASPSQRFRWVSTPTGTPANVQYNLYVQGPDGLCVSADPTITNTN